MHSSYLRNVKRDSSVLTGHSCSAVNLHRHSSLIHINMDTHSNKIDEETKLWLDEKLIPNLKVALKQEDCSTTKYDVSLPSVRLFVSSVLFLEITFTNNGMEKVFSLVVKRPNSSECVRETGMCDNLFHNEILFYKKYAENSEEYPMCLYTVEEPPINSVIVMENISKLGYHMSSQMVDIDMKYIVAAMHEIGRFHAKGYILKSKSPDKFFEIVKNIRESRFVYTSKNWFPLMINNIGKRVLNRLRKQDYDKVFCDKIEPLFNNAFEDIMKAAINPRLPLATLCHGDFTRNNIFFKDTNSGIKAMLIDFALISYGSPTIDLSTFIYLSVSKENRRTRFSEIFDAYYDSLFHYLHDSGFTGLQEFSKKRFLDDYKRYALFGYMIASFFLPIMMGVEVDDIEFMNSLSEEELLPIICNIGGEKFEEIFTEMLIEMRESGCLDHIHK